ncbi:MAG: hypothetical protein RR284_03815, partial [Ruthenibacterium sp.]
MIFTAVQIILTQASIFSLCRYRDGRTLFTGFSIATYVFAGSIFGVAAFYATEKIMLSLLFEALVALLILAVGVLGFVALQYRAIEASSEGANRVQAINLARDLAEKI